MRWLVQQNINYAKGAAISIQTLPTIMKLCSKKLLPTAQGPTVAHPGADLGDDLYVAEAELLPPES